MGRIHGVLRMEEVLDEQGRTVTRGGRAVYRLLEPLAWHRHPEDALPLLTVPAGFQTDLASIPRLFRGFIPSAGPYQRAAVLHDYVYATRPEGWTRKEADQLFLDAMEAAGVNWITRHTMHAAVRAGGWKGWGS